jgi:hypothetical protein
VSAPRSIIFAPLPQDRRTAPDEKKKVALFVEPEEDILLLGLMMSDSKIIADVLQTLPFGAVDAYRGNLRVVAGATERLCKRCAKLLGEATRAAGV